MGKCFFIRTSPVLVFHTHTCLLIACLHAQSMLAYPSLAYLHCVLAECQCVCVSVSVEVSEYVVRMWWKCQCVSVSVKVSVFKGFSGRTLRNAFGKNYRTHTCPASPWLSGLSCLFKVGNDPGYFEPWSSSFKAECNQSISTDKSHGEK